VSGVTTSGEFTTVSDRISRPERSQRASTTPALTKAERRAAGKAARAAAARRRRRTRVAVWAGAVTLVLIIAVTFVVASRGEPTTPAGAPPCGSAAFPPVPAGADPALCTKPTVGPGSGELTKLNVTTLVEGTGAAAASGQNLSVNYVGVSYTSGEQFAASWDDQQTFPFKLNAGEVIDGWAQGLVGVKVGSRVQLDIPTDLAYGENPAEGRPAGPLRFVVDLLAVA
jgi:peptidylprolyl isomerase